MALHEKVVEPLRSVTVRRLEAEGKNAKDKDLVVLELLTALLIMMVMMRRIASSCDKSFSHACH